MDLALYEITYYYYITYNFMKIIAMVIINCYQLSKVYKYSRAQTRRLTVFYIIIVNLYSDYTITAELPKMLSCRQDVCVCFVTVLR